MKSRILILALMVFCSFLLYRWYTVPKTADTIAIEVYGPKTEETVTVAFYGPWDKIDFEIEGQSIYNPVPVPRSGVSQFTEGKRARAAFDFMKENFYVWNAPLKARFNQTYLYGFGYGLCGRESTLLTMLWRNLGLESQSIHWPHHVMAQVQIEGSYCLFDAQHHLDFEEVLGEKVDIRAFQETEHGLPDGFDAFDYSYDYLTTFFSKPGFELKKPKKNIAHPLLSLSTGQKMVLRKRPSNPTYPLPLSPQFRRAHRSHLVPNYELEITFRAEPGERVVLNIDLPFLGINGPQDFKFAHASVYNKDLKDTGIEQINTEFFATEGPVVLVANSDAGVSETLKATFLMAGWLGDRFFALPHQEELQITSPNSKGAVHVTRSPPDGTVWIEDIEIQGLPIIGHPVNVQVTLAWKDLNSDTPLNYTVFLDALMSRLPFEVWQFISTWEWTFMPEQHEASGTTVFNVAWVITEHTGRYRPPKYRTLIGHVKGPRIDSGQPGFLLDFVCTED